MLHTKDIKDLDVWIEEKLTQEFRHEASTKDNKQLALWYLYFLKQERKANKEIFAVFLEIFKKISKNLSRGKIYDLFDFGLNEFSFFDFSKAITMDLRDREFINFLKKEPSLYLLMNQKSLVYKNKKKNFDNLKFSFIDENLELGEKWISGEEKVIDIRKLENYDQFREGIEKLKKSIFKDVNKTIVILKALILFNNHDMPSDAFLRAFGEDERFKEEYYEIFEKYWKMSPYFLPNKAYHCKSSFESKTSHKKRLKAIILATFESLKNI